MQEIKTIRNKFYPYLISLGLVLIITLLGEFVKRRLEPTNIAMLYLLVVVIIAIAWGQGPAIATSIISVLAFDFFLVPPYLTLSVAHLQYIFTFIVFLIVGIVVSTLASKPESKLFNDRKKSFRPHF